jgi:hypothetical protein
MAQLMAVILILLHTCSCFPLLPWGEIIGLNAAFLSQKCSPSTLSQGCSGEKLFWHRIHHHTTTTEPPHPNPKKHIRKKTMSPLLTHVDLPNFLGRMALQHHVRGARAFFSPIIIQFLHYQHRNWYVTQPHNQPRTSNHEQFSLSNGSGNQDATIKGILPIINHTSPTRRKSGGGGRIGSGREGVNQRWILASAGSTSFAVTGHTDLTIITLMLLSFDHQCVMMLAVRWQR